MKKIVALILALVCVFALCACSGGDNGDEKKTLVMATNATFPPYEYYEGKDMVGIDVEIAQAIADKLSMELEIQDMAFDAVISSVASGKADMGMAGLSVTPDREKQVKFSDSYCTGIQVIIVPEDSDITSADDILAKIEAGEDIQIGCQVGTTGYTYSSDTVENGGFGEDHVQAFPAGADAIAALLSDKIDCVIIDNEPAKAFVERNDGLVILDSKYVSEDYAIAFAKDSEIADDVNKALQELIADGTVAKIIAKYINAD